MTPGIDRHVSLRAYLLLFSALSVVVPVLEGCGSGSSMQGANTTVRVLATSTADDRLTQFTMGLSSVSLVSSSGKEVPILNSPIYAEFIHLNGINQPLWTASVPPGTYTSAKASIGFSMFNCVDVSQQGGLNGLGFGGGDVKPNKVTIMLPKPIEISGDSSTIALDMLAGPSSSKAICDAGINSFNVTPTFALTQPAVVHSISSMQGVVQTVNSDGTFTVSSLDGPVLSYTGLTGKTEQASPALWEIGAAPNATYSGIRDATGIVPGLPVDLDVALTSSGAFQATRIATYDANVAHLTIFTGPLLSANSATSPVFSWARGGIGNPQQAGMAAFSPTGAKFAISSAFANLAELPFTPRFDASSFTWGQTVSVTTHQPLVATNYLPVSTVTLLPQTLNGAVQAITTVGNFTEYTVSLQAYDLFPQLALQWGQSVHLNSPNIVTVYADKYAQSQTVVPIAMGGVYRFNGLVFNDNGALRMDCAQISDGVID